MQEISIINAETEPQPSFLSRFATRAATLLRRITGGRGAETYFTPPARAVPTAPPPPAAKLPPTLTALFGNSKSGAPLGIETVLTVGNRELPVNVSANSDGALQVRPSAINVPRTRARSKPNGVSGSSSGAYGVTDVATRVSQDVDSYKAGLESFAVFSSNSYWREFALSDTVSLDDLRNVPLHKIGELLSVVSPEVSAGLYIRNIFSNSGYEVNALKLDKDERDDRAQKELDAMRRMLARRNGTEDVFFNRLFNTYFMRGSILAELVLQENARDFAGIVTPDPITLKFKRVTHPILGTVWDFGQYQNSKFVSLDIETVRYVPLNPFTDSIEGQPLISSSFFIAIFMMAVLRDFKRVIQQQGYPRYDIEIDLQALENLMPDEAQQETPEGESAFQQWAVRLRDTIKAHVADLEPDETFIHFKGVNINAPVGAMGTNSLTSIDGLFKGLERMAARALKVPPVLLGITDSVNETNANRQFETFLIDIGNGQHAVENAIGSLYELGLQAKGIAARVEIRFAVNRAAERLRDAQADMTEAQVAELQYQMGWISQNEAAKRGAKVDEADQETPRQTPTAQTTAPAPTADPNAERAATRMPTAADLQQAAKVFQEFAPDGAAGLIYADNQEN